MNITIKTNPDLGDSENMTNIHFTVMEKDSDGLWTIWDEHKVVGNKYVAKVISSWLGGLCDS